MKYLIAVLLCLVSVNVAQAQELKTAGEYLDFINTQYVEMFKDMMSYTSAVNHGKSARKVDRRRGELLAQLKESERNTRKMKPFKNDTQLRDSIAAFFRMSQFVLNEDYGKILNLEDIAEQSYDAMEGYLLAKEKASEKLDQAFKRASEAYKSFAAANNIKLIENDSKVNQKMEAASRVNEYYNKIFLIFFKSSKNEAYCLDGLNRSDVNAMEQANNSLINSATEDVKKLGPIPAFEGDASLKAATQQVLSFFKKESAEYFPAMIDFQLKKETFEKMDKAFKSKKQNDLTQQDIDTFNRAVQEFNAAVKKSNTINDQFNKTRQQSLEKWNSVAQNFLDTHTPKYR